MNSEGVRTILGRGPALILMHSQSDPDALATAILVRKLFSESAIGVFGDMGVAARQMAQKLDIEVLLDPELKGYDVIAVVDSSTPEMVSPDVALEPDLVIDHHFPQTAWQDTLFIGEDRPSCVEVVIKLLDDLGIEIDPEDALAGIAGILSDTARFRFSDAKTLNTASRLLSMGGEMANALSLVESDYYFDVSRRVAHLKACQRIEYWKIGNVLIAASRVSSFESSVARNLLQVGADIAMVVSPKKKEYARISLRASHTVVENGLHLGLMLKEIGEELGGWGGGHPGAAGLNVPDARIEEARQMCIDRLVSKLNGGSGS